MTIAADILWFKTQFAARMKPALAGTPLDVDMLCAIAYQETGSLWSVMRHDANLTADQIAALCCGDMLDFDKGRRAFPRTFEDLIAAPKGQEMFAIARKALLDMAARVPGYGSANTRPKKFAHGYGVFQYDLQFFLVNPDYFLEKRYEIFENSLAHAVDELKKALKTLKLQNAATITDLDFCHAAICYNTGGFVASKGLKQGHADGGVFYGEHIRDFLHIARTVATPGTPPVVPASQPGTTTPPPAGKITATGPAFVVDTTTTTLRLRSEAKVSVPGTANVIAELPDGQTVQSVTGTPVNGFIELEVMLGGKLFHGFAGAQFLKPAPVKPPAPAPAPPVHIPAAVLANPAGTLTKRTARAGALPLNEPAMPGRTATDPAGLRADLGKIIDYLACDDVRHTRYQPRDGLTFCNIYAHDYCTLAGAYLPHVWWTGPALLKIAAGQTLEPKIAATVDEVRANDLFRWLRDFGQDFGWRRASGLTELQGHADMGGIALIVARRKEDGKSGHIVCVVPETQDEMCKRDANGFVTMPLQSQAGAVNFRYSRSTLNWWLDPKFAEAALWIHA